MHVLLKSFKNSFGTVNFAVTFEAVSGDSQTMVGFVGGPEWWWRSYGWSWTVVGSGGEIKAPRNWLWLVVGGGSQILAGRGWPRWSFLITYFYRESESHHSFPNSICARRGRSFMFKGKRIQRG